MKIVPQFTVQDVKKFIEEQKENIMNAIVSRLHRIGEQFITNAKNNGNYKDKTGNLRSSIGYKIIRNGVVLFDGFTDQGTVEGLKVSKEVMDKVVSELISMHPNSIILVCVAGMEYAASVESHGYDVITGSSLIAEQEIKKAMKGIEDKVNNAKG